MDGSDYQERLVASLGLLQVYNASSFVMVNKAAVESAMQEDAEAAVLRRHRWPVVTIFIDAVQRVSKAALLPFRPRTGDLFNRALQGDPAAQYDLAILLERGSDSLPADLELSQLWLRRAGDKMYPAALEKLSIGTTMPLIEAPCVEHHKLRALNLLLDPFTRIWSDWRRLVALNSLFSKLFPSSQNKRADSIPYLLDYDDDDEDDF